MRRFASVVAAWESGITQAQLDQALQHLIIEKIHDESTELQRIGRELDAVGNTLENDDTLEADKLAHALKIIDNLSDQIATARMKLQHRIDAPGVARYDAAQMRAESFPQLLSA